MSYITHKTSSGKWAVGEFQPNEHYATYIIGEFEAEDQAERVRDAMNYAYQEGIKDAKQFMRRALGMNI